MGTNSSDAVWPSSKYVLLSNLNNLRSLQALLDDHHVVTIHYISAKVQCILGRDSITIPKLQTSG